VKRLAIVIAAVGLVGTPALAADMAVSAPPPPAPVYSWTGAYVGGNVGYGWGNNTGAGWTSFTDPGGFAGVAPYFAAGGNVLPAVHPRGVVGGGQVGYDWQISPLWVTGLIADFQASGMKDSASATFSPSGFKPPATSTQSNSEEIKWLGTVRGKVGIAPNNWLVYGTGGLAYGKVSSNVVLDCAHSANPCGPPTVFGGTASPTRIGWTVGGGFEYGFLPNWTVGAEYLYFDLGEISTTAGTVAGGPIPGVTFTATSKFAGSIARLVLNYKF
jgi:outer membrane immunogenic protein